MRSIIIFLLLCLLFKKGFAENHINYPQACAQGQSIVVAAVGDVLLHQPLQIKASQKGFESLWHEAIPYIKSADIAYANLEGPIAEGITLSGRYVKKAHRLNTEVYSDFPLFNYPPSLADALKDSGFDIVSTANNHALDRYAVGIDKTIVALNNAGVSFVGTKHRAASDSRLYAITTAHNIRIAWISCTQMTNGNDDKYHQVLYCYGKTDRKRVLDTIQHLKTQVDAIIVSPHWGEEYETYPNEAQIKFAHQVLDAGATAVIGSHPHVLQPLQKYVTSDGRPTIIMYSLGNFVSFQGNAQNRSTVILLLGLTKTPTGTVINGVRFVPMFMQNRSGIAGLKLAQLSAADKHSSAYQIISRVMPMGNALYSLPIVTNEGC